MTTNPQRSAAFARFVGLELKGAITARAFTAKQVAVLMGRAEANFNRWLNGRVGIPLAVVCEACEVIGANPAVIVQNAYDRLLAEHGSPQPAHRGDAPAADEEQNDAVDGLSVTDLPHAAKRGRRRVDDPPHAE